MDDDLDGYEMRSNRLDATCDGMDDDDGGMMGQTSQRRSEPGRHLDTTTEQNRGAQPTRKNSKQRDPDKYCFAGENRRRGLDGWRESEGREED